MSVDIIELKTREISPNFLISFGKKLLYVGEPGEQCEEFESVAERCPDTNYMDLSTLSLSRSDLTRISRMVHLHTLILDSCKLRSCSLGFLGQVTSVNTLSLNNNDITQFDVALNIISHSFPNLSFVSFLGNPFHSTLTALVDIAGYRIQAVAKIFKLRILDCSAVTTEEMQGAETQRLATCHHDYGLAAVVAVVAAPDAAVEAIEEESRPNLGKENLSLALDKTGNGTTFRKLRFRYKGTESEGNRYIKNMQL